MVMRAPFSKDDHARIADAIARAEATTSGEIFAVVAKASDSYLAPAAVVATTVSLAAGLLAALAAALLRTGLDATHLALAQCAGAILLFLAMRLSPWLRLRFVPSAIAARRAHRTALAQFMAHGLHLTDARTGVLLFVSQAEHHAEIVADAGINARVPQEDWDAIVALLVDAAGDDRLADGFVAAIERSGLLLSMHFPKRSSDANEVADRLVEI